MRRPRDTPNLGYYLFSNVRIENRSVAYYHPEDQPPPDDAPTECATSYAQSCPHHPPGHPTASSPVHMPAVPAECAEQVLKRSDALDPSSGCVES